MKKLVWFALSFLSVGVLGVLGIATGRPRANGSARAQSHVTPPRIPAARDMGLTITLGPPPNASGLDIDLGLNAGSLGVQLHAGVVPTTNPPTLLTLVNALRASVGVAPLVDNPELDSVAQQWVSHIAAINSLVHNPNLATQVPTGWTKIGENLGKGSNLTTIYNALVASPVHHANMVDPVFNRSGVGVVTDSNGQIWVAEDFGAYPPPTPAVMTFPTAGTRIFASPQTFTWAQALGGQYYSITVGTTQGGESLVQSGQLSASTLSYPMPALPKGNLWVRLFTYTQGMWIFTDTAFTVT